MSTHELAVFEGLPVAATKMEAAKAEIDFNNPTLTLTYGAKAMDKISGFADSLLSEVKVKDSGPVGQGLSELMLRIKDVNLDQISQGKKGFLQSIPLIGSLFNTVERTIAQFDTVLDQVDGITKKLDEAMVGLLKDIQRMELLYGQNKIFYEDLTAYIQAGEAKIEEVRNGELVALEAKAKASGDNLDAQNVRDLADKLNRFERRIHDLKLSRTITLQTAPQIRMIQSNDQSLAEKIQTSILATIPIWKNQMVLALSIHKQQQAANLQKEVNDTTNEMLRKNAEMLQSATLATAREVERPIVELDTLKDVQQKLIATIEETMTIARNGHAQRQKTEIELQKMEEDLRVKLTDLARQNAAETISRSRGLGQAFAQSSQK
ncbi:MAG: toxic anion resistance protein [Desulfovibrionaceae bacterium]|nr:toxic anion resistance protein [Desulfovibrionaceae bacterium]